MKNICSFCTLILLFSLFITSCEKDDSISNPTINLLKSDGYINSTAILKFGETVYVGIQAISNGDDKLVKFVATNNGTIRYEEFINSNEYSLKLPITKGIADKEIWKFTITDIAGNSATDSVIITANFGEIIIIESIKLGAQKNSSMNSFYSFNSQQSYDLDNAFNHQSMIDFYCFYKVLQPSILFYMSFASPGSNISGIFDNTNGKAPESYTTKQLTYFVKTNLSTVQYDAIVNDGLIMYSFEELNKVGIAQNLTQGNIYAFKLQSGKYGLFKVLNVSGEEVGSIEIAVKIQK